MQLQVTKTAEKAIKKLDKDTRQRIIAGIKKLPFGDIKKLKGYEISYRLRIGNYRVLYTFDGYTYEPIEAKSTNKLYVVVNLNEFAFYKSGTGTEEDPYIIR